ncbi:hypothetical protein ANCDUO_24131, partial [Ancylostoma duodenale]
MPGVSVTSVLDMDRRAGPSRDCDVNGTSPSFALRTLLKHSTGGDQNREDSAAPSYICDVSCYSHLRKQLGRQADPDFKTLLHRLRRSNLRANFKLRRLEQLRDELIQLLTAELRYQLSVLPGIDRRSPPPKTGEGKAPQ